MEEIYANIEYPKPVESSPSTPHAGPKDSKSRLYACVLLCLGLLTGLITISVLYFAHDSSAELAAIKANLTEGLQASNEQLSSVSRERDLLNASLTEMTEELNRLHDLSRKNFAHNAAIKANLTEGLRASNEQLSSVSRERDLLNAKITEMTKELNRLHTLCRNRKSCPAGWMIFGCSCYFFSTQSQSWESGRQNCKQNGADLVLIDNFEEQEFLAKNTKKNSWIGLNDVQNEGKWKWIDDSPLTTKYWAPAQPDNGRGDPTWGEEDCGHIRDEGNAKGNWNDLKCETPLQWICEKNILLD